MRAAPDLPAFRQSIEDLRELPDDLEVLARVVRELVALRTVIDAGLPRPAVRPHPGEAGWGVQ
ncbi:MAG TPA: hypothetical protein VK935_12180 [Actinomycetospora sp.]|nr:hypothetical protein [Actinomycetospora sp.]